MPARAFVCAATFAVAIFGFNARCAAELSFSTTRLDVKAASGQALVHVKFPFKNTGKKEIRFVHSEASCGCMASGVLPRAVAAGEEGVITVDMSLKGRSGHVEGTLLLSTEPASRGPYLLTVAVDIVEQDTVRPRTVVWDRNEPLSEKTVNLSITEPRATSVSRVECFSPVFEVSSVSESKPGAFDIAIRVKDTSRATGAVLKIKTVTGKSLDEHLVFAQVR